MHTAPAHWPWHDEQAPFSISIEFLPNARENLIRELGVLNGASRHDTSEQRGGFEYGFLTLLAPGWTQTPIWKPRPRAKASTEESAKLVDFYSSVIPLGRWGQPEELSKAGLFLASEDSTYINAVELVVDGGATGAPFGPPILRG